MNTLGRSDRRTQANLTFVSSSMHLSVLDMLESHSEPSNAPLLRLMLKHLLAALDFLHTEAGVVHTGSNFSICIILSPIDY